MALVKVEDSTFVRDTNSMALINIDMTARDEYYAKAKLLKGQKEEINNIKLDIDEIKSQMSEIKSLLIQLSTRN
jgi:hypothetical protein